MVTLLLLFGVFCVAYTLTRVIGWLAIGVVWILIMVPVLVIHAVKYLMRQKVPAALRNGVPPSPVRTLLMEGYEYDDGSRVYAAQMEDHRNHA